jgi:hypothetical protein
MRKPPRSGTTRDRRAEALVTGAFDADSMLWMVAIASASNEADVGESGL